MMPSTPPPTFIVIQPNPIVSMDLAGLLETAFPASAVHLFGQFCDALGQIESTLTSACIMIDNDLVTAATLIEIESFVARGARMVVVGASDGVSFAASIVNMPFSTEMVLKALA